MTIPTMDFKYNIQTATGDTWKRASSITIYNDYGQIPRVMFAEEQVVEMDGTVFRRPAGELMMAVDATNIGETFEVLNPDGTPSGQQATVATLAALLTSAYVHFADKRDAEYQRLLEMEQAERDAEAKAAEEAAQQPAEPEPIDDTEPEPDSV